MKTGWIKEDKRIYDWMPALIWGMVVLFFTALPYSGVPQLTVGYFDKIAHFMEYTLFSVLILRGAFRSGANPTPKVLLFALIFSVSYGIVMELLQLYIPGRTASFADGVANLAGSVFGLLLGKVILWQK